MNPDEVVTIKAKFSGKCPHCNTYYPTGTVICKDKGDWKWRPVDCPGCVENEHMRALWHRIAPVIFERYRMVYILLSDVELDTPGVDFCTPETIIGQSHKDGLLDLSEVMRLRRWFGDRGLMRDGLD